MDIIDFLFKLAEFIGTVAFAVSGAMIAIERGLDLFGVCFLGITTALGGGIIRDIILGEIPPHMFYNYKFLTVALVASLLVFIIAYTLREKYFKNSNKIDAICNIFDAVGLAAFSVIGVSYAVDTGFLDNPFLCSFLGMTTGIGGGVLRDMLTKTIPFVLQKRIYAVAALAGSILYWGMTYYKVAAPISMCSAMTVVIVIRVLATYYKWNLPKVQDMKK